MRAVKTRRLLALLFVVPLFAACGGEDEPESADRPSDRPTVESEEPEGDACSLLSTEEVAEAVGAEVQDGVGSSSPVATGGSQTTCTWKGVENPAATAMLAVYTDASAADSVREDDSAPLPEVGEDAFEGPFASVWAYAGDGSFTTQWYDFGASDEENLPKSVALAQLYLDKI
jgi:hypothetical protein